MGTNFYFDFFCQQRGGGRFLRQDLTVCPRLVSKLQILLPQLHSARITRVH